MKLGCGHPMGPLTLLDFVGLDTTLYIADIMFERVQGAAASRRRPCCGAWSQAGMHGKKSGKGFYDYAQEPPDADSGPDLGGIGAAP